MLGGGAGRCVLQYQHYGAKQYSQAGVASSGTVVVVVVVVRGSSGSAWW